MPNRNNQNSFVGNLARHIGQTVTIFTTSGGESGAGFTGVLVSVNCSFVRLITQIGSAPGCALGNCCDERREEIKEIKEEVCADFFGEGNNLANSGNLGGFDNQIDFLGGVNNGTGNNRGTNNNNLGSQGRATCRRFTLGSVIDIPVDKIASFVHNAVGSGWQ